MVYACLKCGFVHNSKITKEIYTTPRYTGCRGRQKPIEGTVQEQGIVEIRKCPKCGEEQTLKHIPDGSRALCQKCNIGVLCIINYGGGKIMRELVCSQCGNKCNRVCVP